MTSYNVSNSNSQEFIFPFSTAQEIETELEIRKEFSLDISAMNRKYTAIRFSENAICQLDSKIQFKDRYNLIKANQLVQPYFIGLLSLAQQIEDNKPADAFLCDGKATCSIIKRDWKYQNRNVEHIHYFSSTGSRQFTYWKTAFPGMVHQNSIISDALSGDSSQKSIASSSSTSESGTEITPQYLYKILSTEDWENSQKIQLIQLSTDDAHFIHFSTDQQVSGIIEKYWKNRPYVLLRVETEQLSGDLVFETNPGRPTKYYHLYRGSIPMHAVSACKIEELKK